MAELLEELKTQARSYDEWRAKVKVITPDPSPPPKPEKEEAIASTATALPNAAPTANAAAATPTVAAPAATNEEEGETEADGTPELKEGNSTSYYESLLEGVAPERISIPVLMHALLEQVRSCIPSWSR
jgi:CRISPR-associated protein Cas5t